ncbi:hypothetical protein, partial [Klebsiella pneumoniae]|uniref:hypothetical protein n=1 Tax=Klebsiella pneumoniae TaxID=573 RepID=UPI00396A5235
APVEGIEAPGWILEAGVLWVRLVQGVAQQHLAQLASEGDQEPRTVQRLAQAVGCQAACSPLALPLSPSSRATR